jgi:1-acyl-sn-glycerol-3-phosphate acyltransferase
MIYKVSRLICVAFLKIFFKIEIIGREKFPRKGPFILASNHISHLDPVAVGVGCPRPLHYLAKEELFKNKLFALLLKNLNVIPLKRPAGDLGAIRKALAALKRNPLAIFPQGTRSNTYENFKAGVGFLHKKTAVPVIAARVYGSDKILPKGAKFFKPGKIKVIFDRVSNMNDDDSYEEIAAKVIARIKSL